MKSKLTLTFSAEFNEQYSMVIYLDESVAKKFSQIKPPGIPSTIILNSFEEIVDILKIKQFRKDLFMNECRRLGALLAERMEDAEGWHDESRIEPAKKSLRV